MTANRFTVAELMHGQDYSGQKCAGWFVQRKWNGHFALWDGERLLSREGHRIAAPDWFLRGLPEQALCCELVAGIEGWEHTSTLVARRNNENEWRDARLRVFDAPTVDAVNVKLRLDEVTGIEVGSFAVMERPRRLLDREHLRTTLEGMLGMGGEGLMISHPGNYYTPGRTGLLLKVKRAALHVFRTL